MCLQLRHQLVQYSPLAAVLHQQVVGGVWRPGLGAIELTWLVAALPQLHQDVLPWHLLLLPLAATDVDILPQDSVYHWRCILLIWQLFLWPVSCQLRQS